MVDQRLVEKCLGVNFGKLNYITHLDDTRNLVYVETPKVACTSIKKLMMDQYIGELLELPTTSSVHDRNTSPLKQISRLTTNEALSLWSPTHRRFSFVRNPFSRCLSGYLDKIVTNEYERKRHLPMLGFAPDCQPSLLEFLKKLQQIPDRDRDVHFTTQSALLMIDVVEYDFIGRFENFKRDFLQLQRSYYDLEHPYVAYERFGKHHASSANEKVCEFFGEPEAALVREIYRKDFESFGYSYKLDDASKVEDPVGTADRVHRRWNDRLASAQRRHRQLNAMRRTVKLIKNVFKFPGAL